jgi:hypothetical protein
LRRDEVRQAEMRLARRALVLLAQVVPGGGAPRVVGVELDVVTVAVGRPQSEHGTRGQPLLVDDLLQHGLCVDQQLARLLAHDRIVEDGRIRTRQVPGLEERAPVDVVASSARS